MHHSLTFNFDSSKVCSPAIFETSFSYEIYGLLQLIIVSPARSGNTMDSSSSSSASSSASAEISC